MLMLLQELDAAIRAGRPACYTALVETRGSTPRKAGAAMLVFPDGSQIGTFGGGCLEAQVKDRALERIVSGSTELLAIQLDSDDGSDDGLICGGRMMMLVDPVSPGEDNSYYRALLDLSATGRGATEGVVIDAEISGGGSDGDRWLVNDQGTVLAMRGRSGPSLPANLTTNLRPLIDRPRPYIAAGISFLPILPRCRLVVIGAGHVGRKVAELAAEVDFDVWIVDDRPEDCNPDRFPAAKRLIVGTFDDSLKGLQIDPETYCVIVTRGHNDDERALYHLAASNARYIGMIGSRRKIKLIFDDLIRDGVSRDALRRVHAPLGFDIGSQTVPEIAISIVAELVAYRNLGRIPVQIRPASVLDG